MAVSPYRHFTQADTGVQRAQLIRESVADSSFLRYVKFSCRETRHVGVLCGT